MKAGIMVRPRAEAEEWTHNTFKRIERTCLSCKTTFDSTWAGERICARCKGSNSWCTGASANLAGSSQNQARSGRKGTS
jgi:hypothetical protein